MITLLHGNNVVASRRRLTDIKNESKGKELVLLDGNHLTKTDCIQAMESATLFGGNRLVVIENLSVVNLRSKEGEGLVNYLTTTAFTNDLVCWESKLAGIMLLNRFKKAKGAAIELFKQPAIIFNLLDSILPNNAAAMLGNLNEALKQSEPELIFYMIVRQIRLLLAALTKANISEMKRIAPWQAGKLRKQARLFSENKLLQLYKELLIIDYQMKTGRSATNLTTRLQYVMMNL